MKISGKEGTNEWKERDGKNGKERQRTGKEGMFLWVISYMSKALGILSSLWGSFGVTLGSLEVTLE